MERTPPISNIFNIDCVEYMRSLPDKFFSLSIADPPYGDAGNEKKRPMTACAGRFDRYSEENDGKQTEKQAKRRVNYWDEAPSQEFFDELFRVSKNVIIWGGNYFKLPPTRCFIVWRKTNIPQNFSLAMCEYAWTSFNRTAKMVSMDSRRGQHSGKFHPTEKPVALYTWILQNFAQDGDKIFDPMMGSGSSRIAAYMAGLDYYGCELDKGYFNKGKMFFNRETGGLLTI